MSSTVQVAEALRTAVALAGHAPSVHNSQPWLVHLAADRIEVYVDPSRRLSVLDPTARQMYVSCGAFLHHLEVALRGTGYLPTTALLPDADAHHLATITVVPSAGVRADDEAMVAALRNRHTQREPFSDVPVSPLALETLRQATEGEGAWLKVVNEPDQELTLAVLLSHADRAEQEDPAYREEIARWLRTTPAPDGIPLDVVPQSVLDRHSNVPLRDFRVGGEEPTGPAGETQTDSTPVDHPDEHPALVILETEADSPAGWLAAGRALSRLLLTATRLDLKASMLGQVIDLPGTRAQLRGLLHLSGEPQMVLRLGYGPDGPPTPRRSLSDIIV